MFNLKVTVIWQSFPVKFRFTLRENTGREEDHVQNISVKIVRTCLSQIWSYSWNISNKFTLMMELNWFQSNVKKSARQCSHSYYYWQGSVWAKYSSKYSVWWAGASKVTDCDDSRLKEMTGLRNDSHQSCNVLSVLHLLCQTDLPNIMENHIIHENCQAHGACLLKHFFLQYQKREKFYPHSLLDNTSAFRVQNFPPKIPDIIRHVVTITLHCTGTGSYKD